MITKFCSFHVPSSRIAPLRWDNTGSKIDRFLDNKIIKSLEVDRFLDIKEIKGMGSEQESGAEVKDQPRSRWLAEHEK